MKKASGYFVGGLVVLALAALLIYRLTQSEGTGKTRRMSVPLVQVSHPQRQDVTYSLHYTGDVMAIQQAGIFSKVSGNLEKIYAEMGDAVHTDQLLALIDTTELYLQKMQASATWQNAKLSFDRAGELYSRSLVSKQEKDNAESAFRVAEANLDLAATRLGYARITAPFSGVITRRFLDPGALVSPGSSTLFTLMDLDQVKVLVHVLEKDIPRVQLGKDATLVVDSFPEKEFTGRVTRTAQAVDPGTRTMAVEILVANPEHLLKPGMFGTVTLAVDRHLGALTLPTQAVLRDDQGSYLFIVRADSARKMRVNLGADLGASQEILQGLADTTVQVITAGQQMVKDKSPVQIQP
jgi:RND family efflux transporter MFP subunit